MSKNRHITFNGFTLDISNEMLWRGSEIIHLRPKTFAFLQYLAARPGQLVTKNELLNALWRDCHVGDEALKHCAAEIRKALGDDADIPGFLETVHRRGYRFIGRSGPQSGEKGAQAVLKVRDRHPAAGSVPLVGRTSELTQLQQCLEEAVQGARQIVFIGGEQGIGKTSLVDAFLDRASIRDHSGQSAPLWIARGQCIKSHGAGEAYMPFFEALTGLCHDSHGKRVVSVLRRHAPLWLSQMPSLVSGAQLQSLRRATLGATRERMLREMAEALEALTEEVPLILVLEDLHWSDHSTLDLISYWAQRRGPARLLLIATYRPAETMADDHPLKAVKHELQARQQCREIPLGFLDEAYVGKYLVQRFPGHRFPIKMAPWIQWRTGGNPLFMVNVLDHLTARRLILLRQKHWILNTTLKNAEQIVPPTIQQIIERQIEGCTPQEQRLLQVASVEGVEFSTAGAAAGLGEKVELIETWCRGLAGRNYFLEQAGIRQAEGNRQLSCYRFIHALYHNACYQLLPEELRVQSHRRLAEFIEKTNGRQLGESAARLAMHFDRGHEPDRAIRYYQQAADNANARYAGHEALELATRGMQLLETIRDDPERVEREMHLQIALGTALMSSRGLGAEEVNQAFSRARELFRQLSRRRQSGKKTMLFSALYGLWNYHWVRAEYEAARELAEQLLQLAKAERDPLLLDQAHHCLGIIMMDHGEFAGALDHLEQSTDVVGRCCAAIAKWHLGYPDQALKSIEETLAYALKTHNPENCIFAHLGTARVHMSRRESRGALVRAESALELATNHGLVEQWLAPMKSIRGWALSKLGQVNNGLEQARQALTVFRAIGATNLKPLLSAILAEISLEAARIEEGLAAVEEALDAARSTGMHHYDAEIHRLRGELQLRQIAASRVSDPNYPKSREAESCFGRAIDVARQQQAKSLELRATTSLARLLQRQNRKAEARERLIEIHRWFTEGHNTRDLLEACELLRELQ